MSKLKTSRVVDEHNTSELTSDEQVAFYRLVELYLRDKKLKQARGDRDNVKNQTTKTVEKK